MDFGLWNKAAYQTDTPEGFAQPFTSMPGAMPTNSSLPAIPQPAPGPMEKFKQGKWWQKALVLAGVGLSPEFRDQMYGQEDQYRAAKQRAGEEQYQQDYGQWEKQQKWPEMEKEYQWKLAHPNPMSASDMAKYYLTINKANLTGAELAAYPKKAAAEIDEINSRIREVNSRTDLTAVQKQQATQELEFEKTHGYKMGTEPKPDPYGDYEKQYRAWWESQFGPMSGYAGGQPKPLDLPGAPKFPGLPGAGAVAPQAAPLPGTGMPKQYNPQEQKDLAKFKAGIGPNDSAADKASWKASFLKIHPNLKAEADQILPGF